MEASEEVSVIWNCLLFYHITAEDETFRRDSFLIEYLIPKVRLCNAKDHGLKNNVINLLSNDRRTVSGSLVTCLPTLVFWHLSTGLNTFVQSSAFICVPPGCFSFFLF